MSSVEDNIRLAITDFVAGVHEIEDALMKQPCVAASRALYRLSKQFESNMSAVSNALLDAEEPFG